MTNPSGRDPNDPTSRGEWIAIIIFAAALAAFVIFNELRIAGWL